MDIYEQKLENAHRSAKSIEADYKTEVSNLKNLLKSEKSELSQALQSWKEKEHELQRTIKEKDREIEMLKDDVSAKVAQYEQLASDIEKLTSLMNQNISV